MPICSEQDTKTLEKNSKKEINNENEIQKQLFQIKYSSDDKDIFFNRNYLVRFGVNHNNRITHQFEMMIFVCVIQQ